MRERALGILAAVLAGAGLAAQESQPAAASAPRPASVPAALAELSRRVAEALVLPAGQALEARGYRARLAIELRTKQLVEVEAVQEFQTPRSIRTEVRERGLQILRGFDGRDYWQARPGHELQDLRQREHQRDRATVQREIRLAGQLLRLWRVDRILLELDEPTPLQVVREKVIHQGLLAERECVVVTGGIGSFPFFAVRDEADQEYSGPARVRIWIDRERAEPRQVLVWPAFANTPDAIAIHGERIRLGDFRAEAGGALRVPTHFRLDRVSPRTNDFATLLVVDLKELQVNPDFPPGHFGRAAGEAFARRQG